MPRDSFYSAKQDVLDGFDPPVSEHVTVGGERVFRAHGETFDFRKFPDFRTSARLSDVFFVFVYGSHTDKIPPRPSNLTPKIHFNVLSLERYLNIIMWNNTVRLVAEFEVAAGLKYRIGAPHQDKIGDEKLKVKNEKTGEITEENWRFSSRCFFPVARNPFAQVKFDRREMQNVAVEAFRLINEYPTHPAGVVRLSSAEKPVTWQ